MKYQSKDEQVAAYLEMNFSFYPDYDFLYIRFEYCLQKEVMNNIYDNKDSRQQVNCLSINR